MGRWLFLLVVGVVGAAHGQALIGTGGPYVPLARAYSPGDFGAKADAQMGSAVLTVSGTGLTSGTSLFAAGDVGKGIVVVGAGTGGAPFTTTIAGFTSGTQITLASAAPTALSAATEWLVWGTDDSTAVNSCLSAAATTYGQCDLKNTKYFLAANVSVPQFAALNGPTYPEQDWANGGGILTQVPELLMAPGTEVQVAGTLKGVYVAAAATQQNCATAQCVLKAIAGYAGTGVYFNGSATVDQVAVLGFNYCIDGGNGAYHWHIKDVTGDCNTVLYNRDSGDWNFGTNVLAKGIIGANSGTGPITTNVTGAANNGSGAIRLTVASTTGFATGNSSVIVQNVGGVPAADNRWTITVVDGTHMDLQGSTFAGTYTSGGNAILNVSRPGPAFSMVGTGGQFANMATYGWDVGLYLGDGPGTGTLGATWVQITGFAADLLNVADPTTIGIDIEGHSFGSHIQVSYVGGWYPVKINTTTGSSENNSPHIIEGGMLYTTSCGTPTPKGIWVQAGNAIFVGDQAPCNTITVGTGASAIFSGVRGDGGTSFASGSDLSNTIISGSLFGDVAGASMRGGGTTVESWTGSSYANTISGDTSGNVTVGGSGNVNIGSPSGSINLDSGTNLPTTATGGMVALPWMEGVPTGTPPTSTKTACVIDVTNGYLNCYFGLAWHSMPFTGGAM